MKIHLVDGTYELFRAHFGAPPKKDMNGQEVGATLGLVRSLLMLLQTEGVTHVAVAFDHVIESFRNKMYAGYKTSAGVDPIILNQFEIAEKAVSALGVPVWSMVKFEADDAIAAAVTKFKKEKSVEQVIICSVDKDLTHVCGVGEVQTYRVDSQRPAETSVQFGARDDSERKSPAELQGRVAVQGVVHASSGCAAQRIAQRSGVAGGAIKFEESVRRITGGENRRAGEKVEAGRGVKKVLHG